MSVFCRTVLRAALEVRRGVARVGGQRAHVGAGLGQAALELEGEEEVGELGLAVGAPALVAALLPVEVVEADLAHAVRARRTTVTTRSVTWGSSRFVSAKWPEVVRPDLQLEAVLGPTLGDGHDAGVVDEDVEVALPGVGEGADGREVGEVERPHLASSRACSAAACSPLAVSRTARTTRAPARASSRAATRPMPLLAPVTTTVRPSRAGRSLAVHLGMGPNVGVDNNAVNVNFVG